MSDFLDTSVAVRYLTDDPPELAARAETLIENAERLVLPEIVLVETAHVLRTLYGVGREEVIDLLMDFLQRQNIHLHHLDKGIVVAALSLCRGSGRTSIPDALIWAAARQDPSSVVYSFDQRFPADGIELRQP